MAKATFHFPRGFLWGTATASHQVEGNNFNNDWWAWEQQPGKIKAGHKSGAACDWWGGRWRDDLDRAADAGQNAHRFSIEWSRVQPAPNVWDETAIDRYREIARGMLERGLTPLITLHHFTNPIWLSEQGGWENEAVGAKFERFARKIVEALKEYTNLWITINEPNVLTYSSFVDGVWPPGKQDLGAAMNVAVNLVKAHAAAYHAIHAEQKDARVGLAHNYRPILPGKSRSPLDRMTTGLANGMFNDLFARAAYDGKLRFPHKRVNIESARGSQDFIGINYYTQEFGAFDASKRDQVFLRRWYAPEAELSPNGFIANQPEGFHRAIRWAMRFDRPIIITENGVEDDTDLLRPRYLIEHLHRLWREVNFNIPVKGYFHWSLIDNFEWERGWTQRFGLWELDVETQVRRKRPSADLYAEICKENGLSTDMVERYAPSLVAKLFPE